MRMMSEVVYPINIWINEDRFARLQEAGLVDMAKDVLAGMKVIQIPVSAQQTALLLHKFPTAKCDTATTKTIELLPRSAKEGLLDLVLDRRSVNVVDAFLESLG